MFHALKDIITHRRVLYLMPYGSSRPENIETISDNLEQLNQFLKNNALLETDDGPLFIFYDQEPIHAGSFNHELFDYIKHNLHGPHILVSTEKSSEPLKAIAEQYGWPVVYYFHHAFAAHDWFRGARYDARMIPPQDRKLKKKYITFNRLTSSSRVYRSLLISELVARGILNQGYVSYNDTCPNGGTYQENLLAAVHDELVPREIAGYAMSNIASIDLPLRVDYQDHDMIPNHSFMLSAVEQTQESFCYLVTETCFWEKKHHLTEKIFKPIVSRMPFVLVGPAHNLKYLREYGFKTFSPWIDESYDDVEDPLLRLQMIGLAMESLCRNSLEELEIMLAEMQAVLDHNYNLFYSDKFLDQCWHELSTNIKAAIQ